MIKAVFFDFYHTLVRYEPPREQVEADVLKQLGLEIDPQALRLPLVAADEFIYQEIANKPLGQRSREEKMVLYARYQSIVLREAGLRADEKLIYQLMGLMQEVQMTLALYDDAPPAMDDLKDHGLKLGLISNVEHDINPIMEQLGLPQWLDIVVTSQETGFNKPHPEIFKAALKQAGVKPAEAIYVGDQYQVDVVGARGAGLKGVLIDRLDYNKEVTDCPKIKSLTELSGLL